MRNDGHRCELQHGDVVYFHHLHTRHDLIKPEKGKDREGRSWCRVEGKARPMLILRRCLRLLVDTARDTGEPSGTNQCVWYRVETRLGYWVLSLTSSPRDGNLPCPDLIKEGKVSYVELAPECYPAESVCHRANQPVHRVDDRLLGMIEKQVGLQTLGLKVRGLDHYRA